MKIKKECKKHWSLKMIILRLDDHIEEILIRCWCILLDFYSFREMSSAVKNVLYEAASFFAFKVIIATFDLSNDFNNFFP